MSRAMRFLPQRWLRSWEIEPHPQTAVGAPARLEALPDERAQLFVVLPTRALGFATMRGKAALADFQCLGQGVGGIFGRELFHQREVCGGICQRPPALPCGQRLRPLAISLRSVPLTRDRGLF